MSLQNTSAQPAPDYLATLRLERAPFLDQPDDRFFYADPVLLQRLDLLQHLTRFGDMLIGVIGPDGAGKTTLLQQFLLRGGHGWRLCRLDGTRITQPAELFDSLAECLGLPPGQDVERARAGLLRHCQGLQQGGQLAVAVIDDAQRLPDTVLRALFSLGGSSDETLKAIRIVMFGDEDLERRLTDIGLHRPQQPLLHRLDVPRFDEQQAASYLMYRLAVAGYSGDCPFSLTEIRAIHKAADGRPGRLNVLAHETLMERAQRIAARNRPDSAPIPRPTTRRPAWMMVGLGALILAAGGTYLLMDTGRESDPSAPADTPALALNLPPEPLPPIDTDQQTAADGPGEPPPAGPPERAVPEPEPAPPADPDMAAAPPAAQPAARPEAEAETEAAAEAAPTAAPPTGTSPPAAGAVPPSTVAPAPASETADSQPAPPTEAAPAVAAPAEESAEAPVISAPALPPPAASVAPPEVHAAARPTGDMLREDWVLARPGTRFTLQLLGVRNETALQDYVARQTLPPPVAHFRTKYKGGDWHVLVQGDYASLDDARTAIGSLPAAVRKSKPWPRSFASIQADLKNQ